MDLSLLGNNLKSVRLQRGYSQEKAAELCGVSEKTIGMIERTQANVTVGILSQIETGYRVSLKDLIRDDQEAEELSDGIEYFVIVEACREPDRFAYGIMACKADVDRSVLLQVVHDVTSRPDFALELVRDLNSYQLSPPAPSGRDFGLHLLTRCRAGPLRRSAVGGPLCASERRHPPGP